MKRNLYISSVLGDINKADMGKSHYSYAFPRNRIAGIFNNSNKIHLDRPEIYGTATSRNAIGMPPSYSPPHLIFRPFDKIRILKNAFNISHVPWEFNHLIVAPPADYPHPFKNQRAMLNINDEVWTPSSHAREVFDSHGVDSVCFIPTPVACEDVLHAKECKSEIMDKGIGELPSVTLGLSWLERDKFRNKYVIPLSDQEVMADIDSRNVYLSVFNPEDRRKNIEKILRGFTEFSQANEDALLIVKLVIDNVNSTLEAAQHEIIYQGFKESKTVKCKNILFVSSFLSDMEMVDLYNLSDFYICLSIGEGQNLPLCESMAQGVIPITVAHTAMKDYINPTNACIVPSSEKELISPNISTYTMRGSVHAYDCDEGDYVSVLYNSLQLDSKEISSMRLNAHSEILEKYSVKSVRNSIVNQSRYDFEGYL